MEELNAVFVAIVQLKGSDEVELLSLYCQLGTRWSAQVFFSVAVPLNQ